MKAPMDCCPHCGSEEGYYTKDYAYGSARTYMNFDGSESDNTDMYNSLKHELGKKAYCSNCHKVLFKTDVLFGMIICPHCKKEREEKHFHHGDDYCEFCLMEDVDYNTGEQNLDSPSDDWV